MKSLIDRIHAKASACFLQYIEEKRQIGEPLCSLEQANFKSGFPDYSDEGHASLYLIRYAAAYLAEYFLAYRRLLEADFLPSGGISILSLGSGTSIDGVAAGCALRELNRETDFSYQGVDKVAWPIKFPLTNRFSFINRDIAQLELEDLRPDRKINILTLPKLLSEVNAGVIAGFFAMLQASRLAGRIGLIVSNRNARRCQDREDDFQKLRFIQGGLSRAGYRIRGEFRITASDGVFAGKWIKDLPELPDLGNFLVKRSIAALANDPGHHCCNREMCPKRAKIIDEYGNTRCSDTIGRYPVISTAYFDSHIFLLEKYG